MSDALIGQKVRLPDNCTCGADTAVIGPGNGKYPATLKCRDCETARGAISEFTLHFIQSIAARYGAPTEIVIRAPAIAAAGGSS